ncbi:MAG: acyl-CoA ligase (AMP-forming), exosortase A system-associated [Rhodocyclaceae bacterium]|nr:acyl-CoA ligase (AMP-forming), exosortase A system-associated [Rhodocyclaceae bacterium]
MRPYLIHHLLEESTEKNPQKTCLVEGTRSLTYQELTERSKRFAQALMDLGIQKGEHIGILLDKSLEQVIAMFGTWMAGGVVVLINPILNTEQIAHILFDCEIQTLVSDAAKLSSSPFEKIRNAIIFGEKGEVAFERAFYIDSTVSAFSPLQKEVRQVSDDTSHIIYTSGSTGLPKGIVVSHRNAIDGAFIVSDYTGLCAEDRIIGVLPLNFDYGFNQLMNTVYLGATFFLYDFFMPNDLLHFLEKERISVFAGIPPIWSKLFHPKLCDLSKPRDFSALRVLTNSGGKVPVPIVQGLRKLFPHTRIFLMYGLTEAFRSTYLDPSEIDQRPDSIGKAIPNVEVFVINSEGKECGPHEEGELVHRGALITKGYWNNPEKTKEVFRPNPFLGPENQHLETVVFSGDIVKKDEEGFLYYVGRKDAMIKTKGYRVSPTEVEEALVRIQGVSECVACGYESDGEILLRVFLTVSDGSLTREKIIGECKKRLPFYLVPDDVVILSQFPLTANGKIDRTRVIEEYARAQQ